MVHSEDYWRNPFEKSLVEDWRLEEFPENYREIVACFFPPEFMNKLEAVDVKPKILMGGRGTGKSHILRMLSVQSLINRIKLNKGESTAINREETKVTIEDYKELYFGVYVKATLFSPLSRTNITYLSRDQLRCLFEHLFNMQVGIAILHSVKYLIASLNSFPSGMEEALCLELSDKFSNIIKGKTFSSAIDSLNAQVKMIQRIVKELPWYRDFSRFEGEINFTTAPDFICDLFDLIRGRILNNKVLFILIDEYDELDKYQQEFINSLIRTRRLTFRIASKIGGIKTLEYATGQELDEVHDYDPIIPLHFETSPDKIYSYRNLLRNIFIKRLSLYGNYKVKDPVKLLPDPSLDDEKIKKGDIQRELKEIREGLTKRGEITNHKKYWKNFEGHYKVAAVYRALRKKGRDKLYAGFHEYVSMSSGIVRQFILLCREVFSWAYTRGIAVQDGSPIPQKLQSESAERVSRDLLLIETVKSIPSARGPKLVRLIQDLGRILQAKLYWSTEPQANRFEIVDSQKFMNDEYTISKGVIESGLRMPHFISETAFRPKHPWYSISSFTFSLNAIFAPTLKIPPEKRWRMPLTANELKYLCSEEMREEIIEEIINEIRGKRRIVRGKRGKKEVIDDKQHTIFERPVTLSNCPITNYGCKQNLIEYSIEWKTQKAFLGVPFDETSWVFDPRRWIKAAMTDEFRIRCVDVDDFPTAGPLLCKICSCVRQMPIGLFEITELNPNVIFELGMATGLNRVNFMLVYPEKIPATYKGGYPPEPLSGMEYIPYELNQGGIVKTIKAKILPSLDDLTKNKNSRWCWVLRGRCPHERVKAGYKIFIGLPHNKNPDFFSQIEALLKDRLASYADTYEAAFHRPARSLSALCQLCQEVRASSFCIIDTTYNDISMLLGLGVAFGKDKKFLQLHNSSLSSERPISDLRPWALEYRNTHELEKVLEEELSKRLEKS